MDEFASNRAGEPLESLAGIAARQPFAIEGPRISFAALELLGAQRRRERLDRDQAASAQGRELVSAGLIDERTRRYGGFARSVGGVFANAVLSAEVEARDANSTATITAWSDGSALLLAAMNRVGDDERLTLEFSGLEALPTRFASWIGLAPAWTFAGEAVDLADSMLEQRLGDDTTPPPEAADELMRRAWTQPWTLFSVSVGPNSSRVRFLSAGDAGYLAVQPFAEGTVRLEAMPPGALFTTLIGQVAAAAG